MGGLETHRPYGTRLAVELGWMRFLCLKRIVPAGLAWMWGWDRCVFLCLKRIIPEEHAWLFVQAFVLY
ncbi:hypothetical protein [Paenibacillus sp. 1_12]|uniref:hypothetical protein n=1 Tax=Paenibacillus sp. 1_12 TaxID=1566278 RepID=UPI001160DA3B|nr:hypothetical protein [Paenibacillus sp. 1_12]